MKIAISGSSGFIGKHLSAFFKDKGVEVVPIPHRLFAASGADELDNLLKGCDVVINLAGVSINHRWTFEYEKEILFSRVNSTRALVSAINCMDVKPFTFISVSAVGIYPSDKVYTEDDKEYNKGFLGQVCRQWEHEAHEVSPEVRLVIPRFGVVLANDGGALPEMILPFRMFVGGKIASGNQGFSWIHIQDLLRAFQFIIENPTLAGVFNFTAPEILTNRDFAQIVSHELHRPNWIPVPAFVFRLLFGDGYVVMTNGQRAYPKHLLEAGFKFKYDKLYQAIQNLYP